MGYAQFPWDLKTKPFYDGVVLDYRTIDPKFMYAPYNLNRTAVHEIGHWLGLDHSEGIMKENYNSKEDMEYVRDNWDELKNDYLDKLKNQ